LAHNTGPRRGESFVTSNFAKQVAEIKLGLREPEIYVGNLDAIRDFTDVRDIIRAYDLALDKGEPGEVYNICSGNGYSIKQVLDMLIQLGGLLGTVNVIHDPTRMRPSDVPVLIGDSMKFRQQTGWKPKSLFQETMADLLSYWVEKLRSEKNA
jgi:GDP-4-dehydro-6-deoxy-D-mannose reductase